MIEINSGNEDGCGELCFHVVEGEESKQLLCTNLGRSLIVMLHFLCRHCASFMHGQDGCSHRLQTCTVDHGSTKIVGARPSRLCTRDSFSPPPRAQS